MAGAISRKQGGSLRKCAGEGVSGAYSRWISDLRPGLDPAGGRAGARRRERLTGGAGRAARGRGQADRRGRRAERAAGLTGGAGRTARARGRADKRGLAGRETG